ncbi:MAG: hypothetical protein KAH23_05650 [Kiritimatiellae bacterium]|nr:hypothetical protein [Kiritimatiellia bacterium]
MKKFTHKSISGYSCNGRRAGSALLITMCLSLIMAITLIAIHKMSTQLMFSVDLYRASGEALAIAEAGVSDALQKLADDYDTYQNSVISNTIGDGSYVVTVTSNGVASVIIASVGDVGGRETETILEVLGRWESGWSTNDFGSFGIYCDGFVDVNGQGILHASVYSGDSLGIAPGCTVEGDVLTVGTVDNKGNIDGETKENVVPIEVPTYLFDKYKDIALNNGGDFFMGNQSFKNVVVNPASGVTCVDGDVKIQNGAVIMGAMVARGDIVMLGGHVSHVELFGPNGETLPSLMSIDGDVLVCAGQTLNGFVYAGGDVTLNGGDHVYGGVICHGEFDGRNDWQVWPGDGVIPPQVGPTSDGVVTGLRIGAWLK